MHTGTSTPPARRRRTTETPSRSGIVTSRTMTAGGRTATDSSASWPPAAVDTAKPSRRSARSRAARTESSSSTTRTSGSGVPMSFPRVREGVERRLDPGFVEAELLGQRRGELRLALLVLGRVVPVELVERRPDLGGAQPEGLGERRRSVVAALRPTRAEVFAQGAEGLLELGRGDADRVGQRRPPVAALPGLGRALRAELVEARLDLGLRDAEGVRERLGETVEALARVGTQ